MKTYRPESTRSSKERDWQDIKRDNNQASLPVTTEDTIFKNLPCRLSTDPDKYCY